MRILHTSDWHIGRTFHGASLAREQAAVVDALVELANSEGVEVVVVAGDLYDRAVPSVDAVGLLDEALARLVATGATVVAISGNHDSPARLSFGGRLLATAGLHLLTDPRAAGRPVLIGASDGGPDLAVYGVPYLEPEVARHDLEVPEVRDHDPLLRIALDRARDDLARRRSRGPVRSLATAHAFVAGGTPCESERPLRVGGSDRVGTPTLAGFDYIALGHLHGPQRAGSERARYAGSPLPYSFSEAAHEKGVWLVDLPADPAAAPVCRWTPLGVGRPLAMLTGTLGDLLRDPAHEERTRAWAHVVLTDQHLPADAMRRLQARFPHAVRLEHAPPVAPGGERSTDARLRGADARELVTSFFRHVTGAPPDAHDAHILDAVLDEVLAGASGVVEDRPGSAAA